MTDCVCRARRTKEPGRLHANLVSHTTCVLQGPTLRQCVTRPSGQTPTDQQGHAYLLFVTWKNFKPLLDYLSGHVVKLPRYARHCDADCCMLELLQVMSGRLHVQFTCMCSDSEACLAAHAFGLQTYSCIKVMHVKSLCVLCSDKSDLLELKQTARKFKAKEFERLVNRHLKHLYGGNTHLGVAESRQCLVDYTVINMLACR